MTAVRDAVTVLAVDELVELETAVLVAQWRLAIVEAVRLGERLRADVTIGYGSGD